MAKLAADGYTGRNNIFYSWAVKAARWISPEAGKWVEQNPGVVDWAMPFIGGTILTAGYSLVKNLFSSKEDDEKKKKESSMWDLLLPFGLGAGLVWAGNRFMNPDARKALQWYSNWESYLTPEQAKLYKANPKLKQYMMLQSYLKAHPGKNVSDAFDLWAKSGNLAKFGYGNGGEGLNWGPNGKFRPLVNDPAFLAAVQAYQQSGDSKALMDYLGKENRLALLHEFRQANPEFMKKFMGNFSGTDTSAAPATSPDNSSKKETPAGDTANTAEGNTPAGRPQPNPIAQAHKSFRRWLNPKKRVTSDKDSSKPLPPPAEQPKSHEDSKNPSVTNSTGAWNYPPVYPREAQPVNWKDPLNLQQNPQPVYPA